MSDQCPCCSGKSYADCCEPYLSETSYAPTPEALMRSRFTAFSRANITYIMRSMTDTALDGFDPVGFKKWLQGLSWDTLKIINAPELGEDELIGQVEFIASYQRSDGERFDMHELSTFEKVGERWYYVEGETPSLVETYYNPDKIGRNEPCHCGSGRKFKKCCGNAKAA